MNVRKCNGCMNELDVDDWARGGQRRRTVIEGTRVDGMSGGSPMPNNGEAFHWCMRCAQVAFKAVENAATS